MNTCNKINTVYVTAYSFNDTFRKVCMEVAARSAAETYPNSRIICISSVTESQAEQLIKKLDSSTAIVYSHVPGVRKSIKETDVVVVHICDDKPDDYIDNFLKHSRAFVDWAWNEHSWLRWKQ